jgi:hypothetical protein
MKVTECLSVGPDPRTQTEAILFRKKPKIKKIKRQEKKTRKKKLQRY